MTLVAGALAALAAWLAMAPSPEPRLEELLGRPRPGSAARRTAELLPWVAAGCSAVGVLALAPGLGGLMLAAVLLVVVPWGVRRLETSGERKEKEALSRQAPVVCDLLAATLASGAPLERALAAVSAASGPPASAVLESARASLVLGADAYGAWEPWTSDPAFGLIAEAVARSGRTGAPLADLLGRLAEDLRRERRTVVEVAARSAGVRAVLPLAACFLPAFLLMGVVPVVASLATGLLGA